VPLVLLVLRAVLLLGAAQLVADVLDARGALIVTLVAVAYFDALAFRNDRLNRACGFLCPVVLCIVQTRATRYTNDCDASYAQALVYAVDMTWAVSATSYVAIAAYKGFFVVRVVYAAAVWALLAIMHTLTTCERLDVQHQLMRTVLYYLTCTLYFYHRHAPTLERGHHQLSVLHIFYHVFFVQRFVLLGSVLVAGIVFVAVYYSEHVRGQMWTAASDTRTWTATVDETAATGACKRARARVPETEDDDLAMLRAAQQKQCEQV